LSFAPAEVQLEFKITPDSENRGLVVSAESDPFYRSSVRSAWSRSFR
jgi:hypothetical protein